MRSGRSIAGASVGLTAFKNISGRGSATNVPDLTFDWRYPSARSFENASLTVNREIPKSAARAREEGSRHAPSVKLPDLNSSRIWRYSCFCSGSAAVRSRRIISNAMIERCRLFFRSDFLSDITQPCPFRGLIFSLNGYYQKTTESPILQALTRVTNIQVTVGW